ncbi:unnamed protein product [Dibothriocephalus latus]|uniref:Uncharacterized protein n=1 Tax=Dibothriocephalus latus TaxID=60516 RepID=A0A3P7N904_DIBLA|nr:unnamed protein product [Dibothriocephalus latus]
MRTTTVCLFAVLLVFVATPARAEEEVDFTTQLMMGYKKMKDYLKNDPRGQKTGAALKSLCLALKDGRTAIRSLMAIHIRRLLEENPE